MEFILVIYSTEVAQGLAFIHVFGFNLTRPDSNNQSLDNIKHPT